MNAAEEHDPKDDIQHPHVGFPANQPTLSSPQELDANVATIAENPILIPPHIGEKPTLSDDVPNPSSSPSSSLTSDSDDEDGDEPGTGLIDPRRCIASGPGFTGGTAAGLPVTLTLCAQDSGGKRIHEGGAYIVVRVERLRTAVHHTKIETTITADIADHRNGLYAATYTAPEKGSYQVHIQVNGTHIEGSPFPVFFSSGSSSTLVRATDATATTTTGTVQAVNTDPLPPSSKPTILAPSIEQLEAFELMKAKQDALAAHVAQLRASQRQEEAKTRKDYSDNNDDRRGGGGGEYDAGRRRRRREEDDLRHRNRDEIRDQRRRSRRRSRSRSRRSRSRSRDLRRRHEAYDDGDHDRRQQRRREKERSVNERRRKSRSPDQAPPLPPPPPAHDLVLPRVADDVPPRQKAAKVKEGGDDDLDALLREMEDV